MAGSNASGGVSGMIPYEEALEIVMAEARVLGEDDVDLGRALDRVLAVDVRSDMDMPPFDKSAMDGFACRTEDLQGPMKIIETVVAGQLPERSIGPGECSRIMTGAAVPEGADTVVMVEHTEESDGVVRVTVQDPRRNICARAEDISEGDIVLERGTLIAPAHIATLASVGCDPVPVYRRPVLGVASTGDELVEPSSVPKGGQIRNSNSHQLMAQAQAAGFDAVYLGIVNDTPQALTDAIQQGTGEVDVFLLSGGVSMGDYDHVPGGLETSGFELLVRKVAMKPGKPLVFGKRPDAWAFGLPGNPVSTYVVFELFVKPFCYRLEGHAWWPRKVEAKLGQTIERKRNSRRAHVPVRFEADGSVVPIDYHGSAHIHAYTSADGFVAFSVGETTIKRGEMVRVTLTR
jgi:molybdopterin molybdotransferase